MSEPAAATTLVGRWAPDFEIQCTSGSESSRGTRRLEDYRDRWLLLLFYPRDFSLICPTELSALSDRYDEFRDRGVEILAVSTDTLETHERWIATPKSQGGLGPIRFPLGSDPEGKAAAAYHAYMAPQRVALRGLVIIDPTAVIQFQVVHNMSVGRRTESILRILNALQTGGMCPENWIPGQEKIDPALHLRPGNVISHYRIEENVGAGSFATVFRAFDQVLQREVALKILHRTADQPPTVHAEAQAAAALNHPNVCTVHHLDDSEGILMIVMEFLSGRTLKECLSEAPLPAERVVSIGSQIAAGLAAAHAAGVVHGDLKPANIIITDDGMVKILDFGLAARFHVSSSDDDTLPAPSDDRSTVVGTPAYMSPERANGEPATEASDVFAFGLILFELLAGKRSFEDRNLLQILDEVRCVDAEHMAASVPETFQPLLRSMLAPDPRERTVGLQQVQEMLQAAQRTLSG